MRPRVRRHPTWLFTTMLTLGTAAVLSGCEAGTQAEGRAQHRQPLPTVPTSGVFDYQLGGSYDEMPSSAESTTEGAHIDIVVRDASAQPLTGAYSICSVSGFQTQPDEAALRKENPDLLLNDPEADSAGDHTADHGSNPAGDLIVDPDWPDEHILEPSTADKRARILDIIGPVIDGCADAGFDAVEIDNLDTADRFPAIDRAGAMDLAAAYVDRAHDQGLAIAQKNAAEIADTAHTELGFDFAVAEECAAFDECGQYTETYGDAVLAIEYPDTLAEAGLDFPDACTLPDRPPQMILCDHALSAPDDPDYLFDRC